VAKDYFQWVSGKPGKPAAASPAANQVQPGKGGQAARPLPAPAEPEPAAAPMEVFEGSATDTFIGRVRDFWNRKLGSQ
jgi:hypothetical protein